MEGLKTVVTRTVNAMAKKAGKMKDSTPKISGDFVREVGVLFFLLHPTLPHRAIRPCHRSSC